MRHCVKQLPEMFEEEVAREGLHTGGNLNPTLLLTSCVTLGYTLTSLFSTLSLEHRESEILSCVLLHSITRYRSQG